MHKMYLSDEEFFSIYNRVPRFNVDLVITDEEKGILFGLRSIEPHENMWSLPGGTVYKGESINDACKRVMKEETGLDFTFVRFLGFMEFPDEVRRGINIHTVSVVVEARASGGDMRPDKNAKEISFFKKLPANTVSKHASFLRSINLAE